MTLTPTSPDVAAVTREFAVDVPIRDTHISVTLERAAVSVAEQVQLAVCLPDAPGAQVTVDWGDEQREVTLDGDGAATSALPTLAVGSHEASVRFAGSTTLAPFSRTLTFTVVPLGGSVSASGSTSRFGVDAPGVDVIFVGVPAGSPAATGVVTVRSGQSVLGSAELDGGSAHELLSSLGFVEHSVEVSHGGDARFAPSSTSASVVVTTAPSALEVTWPGAKVFGQVNGGVAVTASVPGAGEDFGDAAGTVGLLVDGALAGTGHLAEARVVLALPAGLAPGAHTLAAQRGDRDHRPCGVHRFPHRPRVGHDRHGPGARHRPLGSGRGGPRRRRTHRGWGKRNERCPRGQSGLRRRRDGLGRGRQPG